MSDVEVPMQYDYGGYIRFTIDFTPEAEDTCSICWRNPLGQTGEVDGEFTEDNDIQVKIPEGLFTQKGTYLINGRIRGTRGGNQFVKSSEAKRYKVDTGIITPA